MVLCGVQLEGLFIYVLTNGGLVGPVAGGRGVGLLDRMVLLGSGLHGSY